MRNTIFRPTLEKLLERLETNPQQYPTKEGDLKSCRAADLRYNKTTVWRCVFRIDDDKRRVEILSLAKHDVAYAEASRRVK